MPKISSIDEVKAAARIRTKLTRAQQADVVRRLAGFESPHAIAKAMKEELGVEITPQSIAFYDPTRYSGKACPQYWSELFRTTRAEILVSDPNVGVVHPMVRLRWLDQMVHVAMGKGNSAEARALLKQAADEVSTMAEQGVGGGGTDYSNLSDAELNARIAALAQRLGYERKGQRESGDQVGAAEEPQPSGELVPG